MTKWWFFSHFSQKTRFDITCKLSPGDNLHEMSILFSGNKERKISQNVVCWKFYPECSELRVAPYGALLLKEKKKCAPPLPPPPLTHTHTHPPTFCPGKNFPPLRVALFENEGKYFQIRVIFLGDVPFTLTHCRLNRFSQTIYWKSNFNFRYIHLWHSNIPRENWLNYLQTVETLIRCHVLQCLIWVCTVCQLPF